MDAQYGFLLGLWKYIGTHPSEVTAYASTAIALLALFLTFYQTFATRKHNRLSVRPHLTTVTQNSRTPTGARITADLINCGPGPAIISRFEVVLDGRATEVREPREMEELAKSVFGAAYRSGSFHVLRPRHLLRSDEQVCIAAVDLGAPLSLPIEGGDSPEEQLRKTQERFHLRIEFKSIYGETCEYDSRNHR